MVLVVTAVLDIIQLATSFRTSTGRDKFPYDLQSLDKSSKQFVINFDSLKI